MSDDTFDSTDINGNNATSSDAPRHDRELLAMVRIASTILRHTDLDQILAAITRELSGIIDFDRSSVAVMNVGGRSLTLRHIHKKRESDGPGDGRDIPLEENSVIGWVAINREPVLRGDIASDNRFTEIVTEESLRCDMVAPLVAHGNVLGTLNVGSYTTGALDESDLKILVDCAGIASGAVEHALLLQEAKDLSERYRTLQRNASDIILLVDRNSGRLVEVNRRTCEALGHREDELLKLSYFDLFAHEDQFQAKRDFINMVSRKSRSFLDRRMMKRDGVVLYVDISANLIEIRAEQFIQVHVHDVSQRKMLEQQIVLQNKNLQEANSRLREVDEMKSAFLSNISHELRTPLSIIIAYTESLREGTQSIEEQNQFLDVISENGASLLHLIDDLLDLSRLEVSGAMLNKSLAHIHDVIRSLWPRIERLAGERQTDISFEPGDDIPVVDIDIKRMTQVLQCLMHNALKFTESGGRVTVSTELQAEGLVVTVLDTGAGMDEDQLDTIFDAFSQGDGSSTRKRGGLGIGLAMARHIVELHGGRIWVESREGVGSAFSFSVPVDSADRVDSSRKADSRQELKDPV